MDPARVQIPSTAQHFRGQARGEQKPFPFDSIDPKVRVVLLGGHECHTGLGGQGNLEMSRISLGEIHRHDQESLCEDYLLPQD